MDAATKEEGRKRKEAYPFKWVDVSQEEHDARWWMMVVLGLF